VSQAVAEKADEQVLHPLGEALNPRASSQQNRIGWLFGGTGLALFTLMALTGLVMRLDQADTLGLPPVWFYRLMTLHAAGKLAAA
jgi:hypothetical protein